MPFIHLSLELVHSKAMLIRTEAIIRPNSMWDYNHIDPHLVV